MEQIPFVVHEADMTRMERIIRRLWILCIILVLALIGSNVAWICYESQFEDIAVEQEVDTGEGDANVIGVGDYYGSEGEDKADSNND